MAIRYFFKDIITLIGEGSGDYFSDPIDISIINGYSVQFIWQDISSFNGTVSIEASNDGTVFSQINESALSINGTDSHLVNMSNTYYRFFRVKISIVTGTANIIANYATKGW